METFKGFLGWSAGFVVLCAVAGTAQAQVGRQPNDGPICFGSNCEPGAANLDGSPMYQSRPNPYVPYSTATPTYQASPHLSSPYPSSPPYGSGQNGSNPYSTSGDDDNN